MAGMRRVDWRTLGLACGMAAPISVFAWMLLYALAYASAWALLAAVWACCAALAYRWLREERAHPRPPR